MTTTTRRITTIAGTHAALSTDANPSHAVLERWHSSAHTQPASPLPSRRQLSIALAGAALALPLAPAESTGAEQPASAPSTSSGSVPLEPFSNTQQGYSMMVPVGWEKKGKAGADVLFEDPARKTTSIGVTVNPVRVRRIEEFGSLETIGQRLLDTERKKESTLGVSMIAQSQRSGGGQESGSSGQGSGATLYDYEYDLNSTRGRKRILNTVTIYNSKLFILNGNLKCDKVEQEGEADAPCVAPPGSLEALRAAARSFDVTPV